MAQMQAFIVIQDILVVVMCVHIIALLRRSFGSATQVRALSFALVLTVIWGAFWSYLPALASFRLVPPPGGQAGAILALTLGLSLFFVLPYVGRRSADFDVAGLLPVAIWRGIFGMSVLGLGVAGGFPPDFYWSVGLGDLAVCLAGLAIMSGIVPQTRRTVWWWNVLGIIDLTHVLITGAITLLPFYLANPDVPFANLLPMAGVPMLLALHVLSLRWSRAR